MSNTYNLFSSTPFKKSLTPEEQNEYFELLKSGDSKAQEIIFQNNLGLVSYVINKYYNSFDEETKKDLFSVGCLELWKAIQKFKVEFGNQFSTYAVPSISGSIKRYIRENNSIHIPRSVKDLSVSILNIQKEYSDTNSEEQLSIQELAKILNSSEEKIIDAILVNKPILSLSAPIYEKDGSEILISEQVADQDFVIYENLEKNEVYNDLIKALNKLPQKTSQIILLSFGFDGKKRSQSEVAKILNISQSYVSKIQTAALKELRNILPEYIKEEYEIKKYKFNK